MLKNALKMSNCFLALLVLSVVAFSNGDLRLIIFEEHYENPLPSTIERKAGTNLFLSCVVGGRGVFSNPDLVWGRRTKELRFKNETDLEKLAVENPELLEGIHNNSWKFSSTASKNFFPLKSTDRGAHFCMSWKYKLFKVIHIKVKQEDSRNELNENAFSACGKEKFRCEASGYCINLHYKCDGRSDCNDDSDENWDACHGNPCEGKIRCNDGRCIPTSWCCDRHTDEDCKVFVRPSCCPALPDPYDPIDWYHDKNGQDVKEMQKSNGSKYLFIAICVISAILSFVLFLFVITKVCGFDTKPGRGLRNADASRIRQNEPAAFAELNRCEHSQCAIRREFVPNVRCLYLASANASQNSDSSEPADPLIVISSISLRSSSPCEISDQPPPYAEVVSLPPSIDKCYLDDLINAPPPPYSSTNIFSETEVRNGDDVSGSDCANATNNNQSTHCDIGITGDSSHSDI